MVFIQRFGIVYSSPFNEESLTSIFFTKALISSSPACYFVVEDSSFDRLNPDVTSGEVVHCLTGGMEQLMLCILLLHGSRIGIFDNTFASRVNMREISIRTTRCMRKA